MSYRLKGEYGDYISDYVISSVDDAGTKWSAERARACEFESLREAKAVKLLLEASYYNVKIVRSKS